MASISRSRRLPDPRSGGKIVRPRRTATAKTPYDRPTPSNSASRNPNWLSRFVFSPTRFLATGAGKLLSSVFDLESSPTSSSSSFSSTSSSSGSDSSAEEEIGIVNDGNDIPFEGDDALKKSGTSEVINLSGKELQPLVGSNKNKHAIEQLLMQETFSREECVRFIRIIRSRVVDSPANDDEGVKRPSDMHNGTLGIDTNSPDLSSAAVMEAKKWLQEKSVLGSNSDLAYGSHSLNLGTMTQGFKDEGSPVDVAKSYMRTRPPWSSPSVEHIKPPTPIGIHLFREETPYLISDNSTSSSKLKRDSPATGSWSIQDEIRRVRSRATEQMLRTLPSTKFDLSTFATVECKDNVISSATENIEASMGEKVHNLTNLMDAPWNLIKELSAHASPDLERKQDGFQPEDVQSDPAHIKCEQNQGFETTIRHTEGSQDDCRDITTSGHKLRSSDDMITYSDGGLVQINGVNDTNGANYGLDSVKETTEASDSRLHDGNCSVFQEKVGAEDTLANGFSLTGPSFYAEQVIEQNAETLDKEQRKVGSGDQRIAKGALEQETCELLSGTSAEVPDVTVNDKTVTINEVDGVATGSQNSSSVQYEFQQEHSQAEPEADLVPSTRSIAEKQKGKRITRYNRRGRGRSRGRVVK